VSFDAQPTLAGRLVHLRPLRPEDHDVLRAVAADRELWAQHPDQTRFTPNGFRRFVDDAIASGGALLASDAVSGEVRGSSRFHGSEADRGEVDVGGTVLARSHWGGPCNGEMKALMLAHAFRFVRHVIFIVGAGNIRSQRAVLKIGGRPAGTRRGPEGGEDLVFRISAEDFPRGPARGSATD
jgi:RimJ/RimL family protein N-acetyltransferase